MDCLYLDNIDEFVNDHNKIVTYKWLSLTLGVHVNLAKQMLFHYLDHKRKESSAPLHATYLVSGKVVENGHTSHKVSVVREDQLADMKSKMSLAVSVHVYSVQKAVLKDSGPLYSVDYGAVKDNLKSCSRYSAIRCASAVPMSSAEVQQAAETRQPPAPEAVKVKPGVNGHAAPTSKPAAKPAAKPAPKGIMGMFANKSAAKAQEASREVKREQKETPAAEAPQKTAPKTNPMSNFFGSQVQKKPSKPEKEEMVPSPASVEEKPLSSRRDEPQGVVREQQLTETKKDMRSTMKSKRLEESDSEEEKMEEKKKKKRLEESDSGEEKMEKKKKKKRLEESDSEEEKMEKKKRRRIRKPQSDSSDDEVIPDSPPPRRETREPTPIPSPVQEVKEESVSHQNGQSNGKLRKRRRVMKSHTFVDEDGCIVTEKAYESESYSEDEAPLSRPALKAPAPTKPSDKKSHKKAAANANKGTKQASIMGFFQKK